MSLYLSVDITIRNTNELSWVIGKGNLRTTKEKEKLSANQQIMEGKLNRGYWKGEPERHIRKNFGSQIKWSLLKKAN